MLGEQTHLTELVNENLIILLCAHMCSISSPQKVKNRRYYIPTVWSPVECHNLLQTKVGIFHKAKDRMEYSLTKGAINHGIQQETTQ